MGPVACEVTILVENTFAEESLAVEHGLSVHVAGGAEQYLLDASASPQALAANAEALSVDLSGLDGVIVSHGHPDHTGGLPAVLSGAPGVKVYAHPSAFARRWAERPDQPRREITWRSDPQALARAGGEFCPVERPLELPGGIVVARPAEGPQPALDRFVVETDGALSEDRFADELFVMARGASGWVVLTGCCHRGLPNTLSAARALAGGQAIHAVLGGLHLGRATPELLARAADALRGAGVERIYPCHCTGRAGREYLAGEFPGRVEQVHGGTRLSL